MISFSKTVPKLRRQLIEHEIALALEPLSKDIKEYENTVVFHISQFYPLLAYSRFLAFSVVKIRMSDDTFILELTPSVLLVVPALLASISYIAFLTIGPISVEAATLVIAVPLAAGLAAFAESLLRTFFWWHRL